MKIYDLNEHIRFNLPDGFIHRTVHDEDGEIQEQIAAEPFTDEDGNEDYRLQINVETKQFASSYEHCNETGFEFSFTVVPFISDEAYGGSGEDMLRSFFTHHTPDGLYRKYMLFPGEIPAAISVLRGYVMGIKMISLQMSMVIDDKTVLNISHQHTGNLELRNSEELYKPLLELADGILLNSHKLDFEGITAKDISVKLYSDSNYLLVEEVRNPANEWLVEYGEYLEKNPKISLKGRRFVFTGVITRDDEKNDPIVQKLMERGGEYRSKVSGLTDCLVVNPMHAGEGKIEAVLDQIDEGKQIQIVHIDDFMTALESESETAAEPEQKDNADKVESYSAAADKAESQEVPENSDYILEGTALKCYVGTGTDLTLPKGITEIMPNAFSSNSELKTVVIPFGVEVIDEDAFRNCFNLQYITLPGTLRKISARAFMGCAALTFIEVPKKTGEIGDQAFYNCFRLKRITIPEHAVLGRDALNTCSPDTVIYKSVSAVNPAVDTEKTVSQANPVTEEIHKKNTETMGTQSVRSEHIHDKQKYPHLFDKYFENNPDIVISDHIFVFCGVKTGDPMMLELIKKGGRYFKSLSKNIDYLVVSPHFRGKAAIEKVISLKKEGYDIKIVHLDDFQKALENAEPVYCDDFLVENGQLIDYLSTEPDVIVPDRVTDLSAGLRYNKSIRTVKLLDGLTEVGFLAFKDCTQLQRVELPDSIRSIDISAFENCTSLAEICLPEGLQKIWTAAFRNCSSLQTLAIPESVDDIGSCAFEKCKQLTLRVKAGSYAEEYCKKNRLKFIIEIPKKEDVSTKDNIDNRIEFVDEEGTLFAWDPEVMHVVIPDGVRRIGVCAFNDCENLTSVIIPKTVTEIQDYAFSDCKNLSSIEIPDSVEIIGKGAFRWCETLISVVIPEGVTEIREDTFSGCKNLSSVEIPDSVKKIDEGAFEWCEALTSIVIPESVTEIDSFAFLGCDNLIITVKAGSYAEEYCKENGLKYITEIPKKEEASTKDDTDNRIEFVDEEGTLFGRNSDVTHVVIPDGVRHIGTGAFSGYKKLISIRIPAGVTKIQEGAFSYCENLSSVEVPDSVEKIGERAFFNCKKLASVRLPDQITEIKEATFFECSSLTSIVIPEGVTKIGESAFWGCENLSSVEIPDSVEKIGNRAFSNCKSLTDVRLPNRLTDIKEYTFSGCSSLTSIVIPKSVTEIDSFAFLECDHLTFTVTSGSYAEQFCKKNGLKYVALESASGQELSEIEIDGADRENAEKEEIYQCALKHYHENSMSGLEEAIELLKKLPGYKDADNLLVKASEGCREIENRNNRIYEQALELMNSSSIFSLRTAMYQFNTLKGWKNSEKHAEFCRKQIDKYNEEIRINQKEAEQQITNKSKKARKKRFLTAILVLLLVIAVVAAFTLPPKIKKYQEYKEIIALGESGKYELAMERLAPFAGENYMDSDAYYDQFEYERELEFDRKEADELLENYENWYISDYEFSELIEAIDLLNEDALKADQKHSLEELRQIAEELDLLYIYDYDDLHETFSNKMDDHNPTDLQKLKTITEPALIPALCEEMEKYEKYIGRTYSGTAELDDFGDTSLSGEAELKLTTDLGFQTKDAEDSYQDIIEIVVIYRLEINQGDEQDYSYDLFEQTVLVGYEPVSSLTKKLPLREEFADSFDDPVAYFRLTEKSAVIDGKVKLKLETE